MKYRRGEELSSLLASPLCAVSSALAVFGALCYFKFPSEKIAYRTLPAAGCPFSCFGFRGWELPCLGSTRCFLTLVGNALLAAWESRELLLDWSYSERGVRGSRACAGAGAVAHRCAGWHRHR